MSLPMSARVKLKPCRAYADALKAADTYARKQPTGGDPNSFGAWHERLHRNNNRHFPVVRTCSVTAIVSGVVLDAPMPAAHLRNTQFGGVGSFGPVCKYCTKSKAMVDRDWEDLLGLLAVVSRLSRRGTFSIEDHNLPLFLRTMRPAGAADIQRLRNLREKAFGRNLKNDVFRSGYWRQFALYQRMLVQRHVLHRLRELPRWGDDDLFAWMDGEGQREVDWVIDMMTAAQFYSRQSSVSKAGDTGYDGSDSRSSHSSDSSRSSDDGAAKLWDNNSGCRTSSVTTADSVADIDREEMIFAMEC